VTTSNPNGGYEARLWAWRLGLEALRTRSACWRIPFRSVSNSTLVLLRLVIVVAVV
jgi:hypothetical protein